MVYGVKALTPFIWGVDTRTHMQTHTYSIHTPMECILHPESLLPDNESVQMEKSHSNKVMLPPDIFKLEV